MNNDGRSDLLVANINNRTFFILENNTANLGCSHNYLAIQLIGGNTSSSPSEYSNRDAIGARVEVQIGDKVYYKYRKCGEGLAAQNSDKLIFGIGQNTMVDSIRVQWPSGKFTVIQNVKGSQTLQVHERTSP